MLAVYRAYWKNKDSLYVMDVEGHKAEVLDGPFDTIDEVIESMKKCKGLNKDLVMPSEEVLRAYVSTSIGGLFP